MVTFAQAQERAERWVNGAPDGGQRHEVRVREFDLGFVVWAEDDASGPVGGKKLVIARDSGDTTLWPALPADEVIQRYGEEYGPAAAGEPAAAPAPQAGAEATSFTLIPPEVLAARPPGSPAPEPRVPSDPTPTPAPVPAARPAADESTPPPSGAPWAPPTPSLAAVSPPPPPPGASVPQPPSPWDDVDATPARREPADASPWAGTDTSESGEGTESVAPPATVFSPPLAEDEGKPADKAPSGPTGMSSEARTAIMPQGSSLPRTAVHPSVPGAPGKPDAPEPPQARDTPAKADPPPAVPGPSGAPVGPPPAPGGKAPDAAANAYVPTQAVSPEVIAELKAAAAGRPAPPDASDLAPRPPGTPSPLAETAFSHRPTPDQAVPGPPPPPPGIVSSPPPAPQPAQHQGRFTPAPPPAAGTPPPQGIGTPPPPPAPGAGYGYPPPGTPTVGSGYMAVLRYRAPDGSEQQLIRRSAPGMPHPEWQILYELRSMNVPPQQVIELHTELQSCELPGAYCARMIRETWPQVRVTHTAAYGRDLASRQAGVRHLVEHQDELKQFADGPPRSAPVRAPLQPQQAAPAVPLDAIGQELVQAYGPQGVFRYTPQAVSRQGVPEIVAQSLVWSGVPVEVNPFFWAQAQAGRPIPTLGELAVERGVQPAPDAGSYLVVGSDFGRQLCVQYGTAHIVAVPLEAGPGGQPVPPQFVNASLPQFARCMALLGRMWRLRYGLNSEQAGRWTTDFQAQLGSLDPQALADPESWWAVLLEQMWDGLL
ncbi:SUKH-4 family immunity protein [Streptomyces sp. NPDC049881]|uniref:SUKH-4 family immunity protein n=1 Tax=Streptomyces sp. NPDC049881 TaxID=3155778 RepID=UPI0034210CB6